MNLPNPVPLLAALLLVPLAAEPFPVSIRIDAARAQGQWKPIYSYFGYDEPNYTYMKDGRKLLTQLAALSPVPVYVRAHNLLTTGDGSPSLKWGSTNAYTEDAQGRPVYDWTIIDRIFDAYVERGMKPLVEIGFMPEALSTRPQPYRHGFDLAKKITSIAGGWAYPPKDYAKWAELVYRWVRHSVERYGEAEVAGWLWELWNEPDISYWRGTPEEYHKLYDYTADAVKRAFPRARMGGPHSTGPGSDRAREFLRGFLEHALRGKNYATGGTGAPLDYIGFHAKGRPLVVENRVQMGIGKQLTDIDRGMEVVASFPEFKNKPIIIGESDPEGCAACSARYYPQNGYRNGTVYSSYTAASFPRKLDLAAQRGVNLEGAVTWAFEFEDQPWFDGFRDLATNGVEKPVLNVFRMLGLMAGERIAAESSGARPLAEVTASGVRGAADVGVAATRGPRRVTALVWHYHDDDVTGEDARVTVEAAGLGAERVRLRHYRVDAGHSNSYEAWKNLGSPQQPTAEQVRQLEKAAALALAESPRWLSAGKGSARVEFVLPRQGVSLLEFSW
jgi:xylan 1,4-beta-xylosidase